MGHYGMGDELRAWFETRYSILPKGFCTSHVSPLFYFSILQYYTYANKVMNLPNLYGVLLPRLFGTRVKIVIHSQGENLRIRRTVPHFSYKFGAVDAICSLSASCLKLD